MATRIDLSVPLKSESFSGDLLMQAMRKESSSVCLTSTTQTSGQEDHHQQGERTRAPSSQPNKWLLNKRFPWIASWYWAALKVVWAGSVLNAELTHGLWLRGEWIWLMVSLWCNLCLWVPPSRERPLCSCVAFFRRGCVKPEGGVLLRGVPKDVMWIRVRDQQAWSVLVWSSVCYIGDWAKLDVLAPVSGNNSLVGNTNIHMQFSLCLCNLRLGGVTFHLFPASHLLQAEL